MATGSDKFEKPLIVPVRASILSRAQETWFKQGWRGLGVIGPDFDENPQAVVRVGYEEMRQEALPDDWNGDVVFMDGYLRNTIGE